MAEPVVAVVFTSRFRTANYPKPIGADSQADSRLQLECVGVHGLDRAVCREVAAHHARARDEHLVDLLLLGFLAVSRGLRTDDRDRKRCGDRAGKSCGRARAENALRS
jgi:hypothetical protein